MPIVIGERLYADLRKAAHDILLRKVVTGRIRTPPFHIRRRQRADILQKLRRIYTRIGRENFSRSSTSEQS